MLAIFKEVVPRTKRGYHTYINVVHVAHICAPLSGDTMGAYAGAIVLSSMLFPAQFLIIPVMAPRIASLRVALVRMLKQK
jgi:hypothetical protein